MSLHVCSLSQPSTLAYTKDSVKFNYKGTDRNLDDGWEKMVTRLTCCVPRKRVIMGSLAYSGYCVVMPHNAAFHQGTHCLVRHEH